MEIIDLDKFIIFKLLRYTLFRQKLWGSKDSKGSNLSSRGLK
jgi:hypothetical protein